MEMTLLGGALWGGGGLIFAHGILTNREARPSVAANSRAVLDDLLRLRPAALVALALFLAVWPALWIGAHLGSR